ncbi:ROK family transcriptional regulator [Sporosarcina ureilytica]|uniref:HTH marR-type domain-containing protein n=1 Tax=Sporosarcina ureilytica TaxID=298596 RepID=A0A1D8JJ35_9BACL|nr:ROK family transcriptional regulator [Sporosarcina ureilytica]AOV08716.1 hypothetical protein BI350_14990 [Sporosarcina ureilytica]
MVLQTKHDQGMLRKHHLLLLLKTIKRAGTISRADLAKITKMSATSVSRIVKDLLDQNFIEEVGETEGNIGRRARLLAINPKGALMFGMNIELEFIEIGVADLSGSVLYKEKRKLDLTNSPQTILNNIAEFLESIKNMYADYEDRILGCGVSIPGIVDWPSGKVITSPQFKWKNVEVGRILEEKTGMSVLVDNQVKAILLGESLYGRAVGVESAACIYIGSGLGGAFMDKGEIIRGANNIAGEIGHTTVTPNGMLCSCGKLGCLQTYICTTFLEKESGRSYPEIFKAKKRNEEWAVSLLDRAAEYLALTISNVVCTYNPEIIILAGALIEEYPEWVVSVKEKLKKYIWKIEQQIESRIYYQSEASIGILGASCLILSEFLDSPIAM